MTLRAPRAAATLTGWRLSLLPLMLAALVALGSRPADAAPEGQLTWGVHITLAPTWFDPAEASGMITPFMVYYALHDAMVKPMPGNATAPALAESWTVAPNGLTYEFVLRKAARFHNGDPVTADDVKFSFERYRGTAGKTLKERVAGVDVVDPGRVRIRLKQPWPDFLTFYSSATGAGWIVPRKYVEKVGDEGYKKAPVGAGPYKFVSYTPGVELVLEAFDQYWRKTPGVKRFVFKVIPDESTRLAALKRGEVDIAYSIRGALAEELKRTPGLALKPAVIQGTFWLYFPDQWDPKSPWHDRRVRQAASLAMNRQAINQAETLGFSKITGSIIPSSFDFYWAPPAPAHDPARAKRLLAEAGMPNGFDAGDYYCDASYSNLAEAVLERPASGRDPRQASPAGAGRVLQRVRRQEVQEPRPGLERRVRQRGHPHGGLRRLHRHLRLWRLSRPRRPVPGAGGRDGPEASRVDAAQDAADGAGARDVRADLGAGVPQRHRPAGRRIRAGPHRRPRVLGAVRGRDHQGAPVTEGTR